jgi:hypothetical protein
MGAIFAKGIVSQVLLVLSRRRNNSELLNPTCDYIKKTGSGNFFNRLNSVLPMESGGKNDEKKRSTRGEATRYPSISAFLISQINVIVLKKRTRVPVSDQCHLLIGGV